MLFSVGISICQLIVFLPFVFPTVTITMTTWLEPGRTRTFLRLRNLQEKTYLPNIYKSQISKEVIDRSWSSEAELSLIVGDNFIY